MAGMTPGLARIEALLSAIGNPERSFRIVQVGGTNGKGSVSAMLAAIGQAAGWRVGLYTSPHLVDLSERIRVDGRPIPEADLVDGVEAMGTLIARLDLAYEPEKVGLELDSRKHHLNARAFERDRERQNLLELNGWMILRYTWRHYAETPMRIVSEVLSALDRRRPR